MRRCCMCGCETVWNNDFMSDEMGFPFENDIIVRINTCPNCGIDYYDFVEFGEGPVEEE